MLCFDNAHHCPEYISVKNFIRYSSDRIPSEKIHRFRISGKSLFITLKRIFEAGVSLTGNSANSVAKFSISQSNPFCLPLGLSNDCDSEPAASLFFIVFFLPDETESPRIFYSYGGVINSFIQQDNLSYSLFYNLSHHVCNYLTKY